MDQVNLFAWPMQIIGLKSDSLFFTFNFLFVGLVSLMFDIHMIAHKFLPYFKFFFKLT